MIDEVVLVENSATFDVTPETAVVVKDGIGIASIEQTETSTEDGGANVVTFTLDDGKTTTFTVRNGGQGRPGKDGKDGEDGYSPVKGVDYHDGQPGKDGKDGYTPIKGVDYFDGEPGKDGSDGYTPVKGKDYFDGEDGKDGKDGDTPVKGRDYFDGQPGKTAYEYAKDGGYAGTESDFAAKLAKEYPTKVSELTNDKGFITSSDIPVKSVNGKTGAVSLTASEVGARPSNWMPTAAEVGARDSNWTPTAEQVGARPSSWTPTYSDVGADKSGVAVSTVSAHNTGTDAHNDIRLLISALATRLDALADSDDETLDQMAEIVAYIKANRELVEQVTTVKISVADIVDNLTTNVAGKPLSAAQGVVLKALIDAIVVPTKLSQLTNDKGYLTGYTETDPTVPAWAKASTKPTYTAAEVGALAADTLPGAVNDALAQAKASGEFDGQDGTQGPQGIQGEKGDKGDKGDTGAQGVQGEQGPKGDTGDTGATGQRGTGLLPVTTAPSSYTTEVNGLTPTYRIALSTVKSQASTDEVLAGDTLRYSYYHYPVIYVDASYVYCRARVNIRGATGSAGAAGTTPVKGTDYWTAEDKAAMVADTKAALPTLTITGVDTSGTTHTWTVYGG